MIHRGTALTDEECRDVVRETLDSLPSDVLEQLGDAAVVVEERHPDGLMGIYDPTGGSARRSSICACRRRFFAHQAMFDPSLPHGWWYYFRSCDVAELTDEVIDITVDHALRMRSPANTFPIFQLGGAVARVGENETAFNGRGAGHTFNINATTVISEGFDEEREWSRSLWSALEPYHTSVYVNFLMDEGEERIREAYGEEKYDRLTALKRRYDPDNFFRLNQNISSS